MQRNKYFTKKDLSIIFDVEERQAEGMITKYPYFLVKPDSQQMRAVTAVTLEKMRHEFERKFNAFINVVFVSDIAIQANYTESWVRHWIDRHSDIQTFCIYNPDHLNGIKIKPRPELAVTKETADQILNDLDVEGSAIQADFFNDKYWPDVIPECFKDMPDDSELGLIPIKNKVVKHVTE